MGGAGEKEGVTGERGRREGGGSWCEGKGEGRDSWCEGEGELLGGDA